MIDDIEQIRARHGLSPCNGRERDAVADRATLLAEVDRLNDELERTRSERNSAAAKAFPKMCRELDAMRAAPDRYRETLYKIGQIVLCPGNWDSQPYADSVLRGMVTHVTDMSAEVAQLQADLQQAREQIQAADEISNQAIAQRRYVEDERDRLQERVASLREAFKHAHVQGPDMNDSSCTQCGLDLRDEIHLRVGE